MIEIGCGEKESTFVYGQSTVVRNVMLMRSEVDSGNLCFNVVHQYLGITMNVIYSVLGHFNIFYMVDNVWDTSDIKHGVVSLEADLI